MASREGSEVHADQVSFLIVHLLFYVNELILETMIYLNWMASGGHRYLQCFELFDHRDERLPKAFMNFNTSVALPSLAARRKNRNKFFNGLRIE
jgi:hypothetical protein